jgi:phenylalanyl-tRNA synthetase alpha chain
MALTEFLKSLDELATAAQAAFDSADDAAKLELARIEYRGAKSGRIKTVQKQLGSVSGPDKPAAGKRFNEVKELIEAAFESANTRLNSAKAVAKRTGDPSFDTSLPGKRLRFGRLHPLAQTIDELKDIMGRLGFTVADGPEIEDERHNFEALNIPVAHPARDPLENFYLATAQKNAGPMLLRSQTSTVQIRVMEQTQPPIRVTALGRVYRPDTADATHYPMFHQIEALFVDRHVTLADLKSVLRLFATSYLGRDVHIRFRPSFFPFTEPSVEADMTWKDGWMEFGGAGMVHPNVLRTAGYDPEEYSGFAFGLGIERLCMRRHAITDIREFYKNDIRFLHQF